MADMRGRTIILMLMALLLCFSTASGQSLREGLPKSARTKLDRKFLGWKFIDVSPVVKEFVENYLKVGSSPVLIRGDFDGNRRRDYAALVNAGSRTYLAIFLARRTGYRMYVYEKPFTDYLMLAERGSRAYNYDQQRQITYTNDSIVTVIFEKGGSSHVFQNGRFRSFTSID